MRAARVIALAATVGNLLQGFDNGAIAGFCRKSPTRDTSQAYPVKSRALGALLYIKPEFALDGNPVLEGIVVASSLVGAWCSTLCSGPGADWLGRRSILCISASLFTVSSCVMLWSPNVPVLILARLLVGAGIGISVTIVPIYIAEIAPPEIRGQLATLPQFMGSGGLFLAYLLCFGLSLTQEPSWRIMLAVLLVPSLLFSVLGLFYLPESPRWLVSKGRMRQAKEVLQRLRNNQDVAAELALLVEGLGVGGAESSLQEWVLEPADNFPTKAASFRSPSQEGGISWIAKPLTEGSQVQLGRLSSRHGTAAEPHSMSLVDPMVTLFGSFRTPHEHLQLDNNNPPEEEQAEQQSYEELHPEYQKPDYNDEDLDDNLVGDFDDEEQHLKTPLLSRQVSEVPLSRAGSRIPENITHEIGSFRQSGRSNLHYLSRGNSLSVAPMNYGSLQQNVGSMVSESLVPSVGIGGGWQLGWHWEEQQEGSKEGGFKRVFLLHEGASDLPHGASVLSLQGEPIQAAALVGQPAQSSLNILSEGAVGPAMMHPAETATKGPAWSDLLEGGVRNALVVGVTLQILQQFSGINAVLYYVPQILQQSGAGSLLAKVGLGSNSASILASGVSSLLMLPAILVAMRLMDQTGRRQMLLTTIPLLFLSLIIMVISNSLLSAGLVQAAASFVGVTFYVCTFMMGLGPIPNILGSEIFPTRVRGVCIGICQVAMWTCNIILTNLFPTLLVKLGLAGIFGCFSVIVVVAWVFTFLKVPETKGMPLEVITEFFAMSAAKPNRG